MATGSDKVLENFYRRKAKRLGVLLQKSRARRLSIDNFGEYRLVDSRHNFVVAGPRYDLTLKDVAAYLEEAEKEVYASSPIAQAVKELHETRSPEIG